MIILSPACTAFSQWHNLNRSRWPGYRARYGSVVRAAKAHILFSLTLARMQMESGRYFLFEHPRDASSSKLHGIVEFLKEFDGIDKLVASGRVLEAQTDQCAFGLVTRGDDGEVLPARKPARFITNSVAVQRELNVKCRGCARHGHLEGNEAQDAARYPKALCRAVCRGVIEQMRMDAEDLMSVECIGSDIGEDELDTVDHETNEWEQFYDDMSGKILPRDLVEAARREEIAEVKRMGVWRKVPRAQCWHETGRPPIGIRWVDVDKGQDGVRDVRSRIVAQELSKGKSKDVDLFSATPPLEFVKYLIPSCASSQRTAHHTRMLVVDVKTAYLVAPSRRRVFIELPEEDWCEGDGDVVGLLERSLYGTRDAAANWSDEVSKVMEALGFAKGASSPCSFFHAGRGIKAVVHGDDFLFEGEFRDLRWVNEQIAKSFTIKSKFLGPGAGSETEIKLLNRTIRWGSKGISWEPDARHVQLLMEQLELNPDTTSTLSVPAVKEKKSFPQDMATSAVDVVDVFGGEPMKEDEDNPPGTQDVAASYVQCKECSALQVSSVEVCGCCDARVEVDNWSVGSTEFGPLLESQHALQRVMSEQGWRCTSSADSTGYSTWSKTVSGATALISNPGGLLRRRTVKDQESGQVIDTLVV